MMDIDESATFKHMHAVILFRSHPEAASVYV